VVTFDAGFRRGRRVECRLARFDPATGALDLDHLASRVDARTRLLWCTGASNFFGTEPGLAAVRQIARANGALFLVDAAQLLPSSAVDGSSSHMDTGNAPRPVNRPQRNPRSALASSG
jgi:cysteine desulfurase / selenocysteine lyase